MSSNKDTFKALYADKSLREKCYAFLQNNYNRQAAANFHTLIQEGCQRFENDRDIYEYIQMKLAAGPKAVQKFSREFKSRNQHRNEMAKQTADIVGPMYKNEVRGYVEIGSKGQYMSAFRKYYRIKIPIYFINDEEPKYSLTDIVDRGRIKKVGKFIPIDNYTEISKQLVADASVDVVTCYAGLASLSQDRSDQFIQSVWRIMKPGAHLIIREYDVTNDEMNKFVNFIAMIASLRTGREWEAHICYPANFRSQESLVAYMANFGFKSSKNKLSKDQNPSLFGFIKVA